MSTLSTLCDRLRDWGYAVQERWESAREEIGRRVATSKRGEIRRLQFEVSELRRTIESVRKIAHMAEIKADMQAIEFEEPARKVAKPPVLDTLTISDEERATFEEIVRGEESGS